MFQITGARVPCRVAGPLRRLDQAGRGSLSGKKLCLWRTSAQLQTGAPSGRDPVPGLPTGACQIHKRSLVLIPPCKAGPGPASGSPDKTGSRVPHSVRTFVKGLDAAGRQRLARCLDLDPALVEQVAGSGRTPQSWQSDLVQEDVLLGTLLTGKDVDTFELACRFVTSMREPPAKIWRQIAGRDGESSPLMDAICRLCASDPSLEPRVRAGIEAIRDWSDRMAITMTEAAARHIRQQLENRGQGLGIRLGIKMRGCLAMAYSLEFVDQLRPEDHVFEAHGQTLFVDPKSFVYLKGTELDFVKAQLDGGFRFNNPNKRGECGCGDSFHV